MNGRNFVGLVSVVAGLGCSSILGLDDVTLGEGNDAGGDQVDAAAPGLTVAAAEPILRVERGASAELQVTVERTNGLEGAVTVDLAPISVLTGVTIVPASIAAGETSGTISVSAAGDSMPLDVGAWAAAAQASTGDTVANTDVTLVVADHPGVPDLSFNSSGFQISTLLTSVRRVTVGPDGRVFVLGPQTVVALTPDGTVDTGFGTNGVLTLTIEPYDLVVRDQGRILVTGDAGAQLAIRAFTSTGAIDATFGNLGEVTFGPADYSSSAGRALALAPDGTVYVGGTNGSANAGQVWRFNATGTEEDSHTLLGFNNVLGVDLQASGAIIAAGQQNTMMVPTTVVTRLGWDGSALAVDTTFGTDGEATASDMYMSESGFAVGAGDTIAVVGKTATSSVDIYSRLGADGSPGFTRSNQSGTSGSPWGHGGAIDSAGRVLAVSWGQAGPGGVYWSASILRFLAGGNLDGTLDADGQYEFDGGNDGDPQYALYDVTLGPYGRIVAVGTRDGSMMVVRLWD